MFCIFLATEFFFSDKAKYILLLLKYLQGNNGIDGLTTIKVFRIYAIKKEDVLLFKKKEDFKNCFLQYWVSDGSSEYSMSLYFPPLWTLSYPPYFKNGTEQLKEKK